MNRLSKNSNLAHVPISLDKFFNLWLAIMQPFHKLRSKEVAILAVMLKYRHQLSSFITDEDEIDEMLLSTEGRKTIAAECNITLSYLQTILTRIRQAGIIKDNKIDRKFIPILEPASNSYSLIFNFDIIDDKE